MSLAYNANKANTKKSNGRQIKLLFASKEFSSTALSSLPPSLHRSYGFLPLFLLFQACYFCLGSRYREQACHRKHRQRSRWMIYLRIRSYVYVTRSEIGHDKIFLCDFVFSEAIRARAGLLHLGTQTPGCVHGSCLDIDDFEEYMDVCMYTDACCTLNWLI